MAIDWDELVTLRGEDKGPHRQGAYTRGCQPESLPLEEAVRRAVDERLSTAFILKDSEPSFLDFEAIRALKHQLDKAPHDEE
jgi:hypothetical protein